LQVLLTFNATKQSDCCVKKRKVKSSIKEKGPLGKRSLFTRKEKGGQ